MKLPPYSSSNQEDNETMLALSQGDDLALNTIIRHWQPRITSFLYRAVGDHETALDLSQEVFVRLYSHRKRYQPTHRFSSYIFAIAANLAKNHFRWKSRHPESRMMENFGEDIAGDDLSHENPGRFLERSEEGVRVRKAILSLPENLRIPVILFYYEELSQAAISEVMNCSEKCIESRLYRARKRLKGLISPSLVPEV